MTAAPVSLIARLAGPAVTGVAICLIAASAWLTVSNLARAAAADDLARRVDSSLLASEVLLSTLKDAETGQRGYLLTGDAAYLQPYESAQGRLEAGFAVLEQTPQSDTLQTDTITTIRALAKAKMAELAETLAFAMAEQRDAALEVVRSNDGKRIMDAIRQQVDLWQSETRAELGRIEARESAFLVWAEVVGAVALALLLLAVGGWMHGRVRHSLAMNLAGLERFTRAFGLGHGMLRSVDGRITFWAAGMEQLYGYSARDAVGRIGHELLATVFPVPLAEIERAVRHNGHWQGELIHRCRDGSVVVVASHWALYEDQNGAAPIVIEINNDITAQKQVEATLRDNEVSLRLALDASELGFWHFSGTPGRRGTFWDDRCKAIFGLTAGGRIDYVTWLGMVHPDDREIARTGRGRASNPSDPHDDYASEYRAIRPDGGVVLVAVTGRALFDPDPAAASGRRLRSTLGTMRDVTEIRGAERHERQQASALLQTIIETAPGLIFAKGLDGSLLVANQPVLDLIGKPWAKVKGLSDRDYLENPAQAEVVMANDRRIMQRGVVEELEEFIGKTGGTPRVWLSTKTPLRDADRNVIGLVGVSIEITERKRAEDRLQTLVHELNHRVKNTLATVQAITLQTMRRADPALRDALEARLVALATAHDVLTNESWQGANLHDVISTALAPFRSGDDGRFTISGPRLRLRPRTALSLSMALHELATNALKYGALAVSTGHVALLWDIDEAATPRFRLTWSESGVAAVAQPERRGFGCRLIEQILAQDMAAKTRLDFAATGVVCSIDAPVSEIVPTAEVMEFPQVGRMGAA
jgi:PAS domain S-box-containing protein